MRLNLRVSLVLIAVMLVVPVVKASVVDLHQLWDDRCAICHGHAGEFARNFLHVTGGELQGRHYVHDLRRFLHNHYLSSNEVDAVYEMLLAQATNQARFRDECGDCHESAAKLVRDTMVLDGGVLYSRASRTPVRTFLHHHRDLEPNDVDFFMKVLTRVAHEVYRP